MRLAVCFHDDSGDRLGLYPGRCLGSFGAGFGAQGGLLVCGGVLGGHWRAGGQRSAFGRRRRRRSVFRFGGTAAGREKGEEKMEKEWKREGSVNKNSSIISVVFLSARLQVI